MNMAIAENLDADRLSKAIEKRRREISTVYYTMSVGEVASLYVNKEMVIDPVFQRLFRWSDEQKTRLVESILLGIPLPPIFVGACLNGEWEVIDGMQRLSTILQFMGKLPDENGHLPDEEGQLVLTNGASYLPMLEGMTWRKMPRPLQLDFRRARLDVAIIQRGGDAGAKYDLFDRLNTGGMHLSDQELRNCHLINENKPFHKWLEDLACLAEFRECAAVSQRYELQAYHMELASRLLIFAGLEEEELRGIGNLGTFITDRMVTMAREARGDPARLDRLKEVFHETFTVLSPFGESAFKRYDSNKKEFKGAFSVSAYEAVACGIAYYILQKKANSTDFPENIVKEKIKSVWQDENFKSKIKGTGGTNAASRLRVTIPCGRRIFQL